jgi:hypothetical protein
MKTCPITSCRRHVAPKQVMCSDHWEKVPSALRKPIRETKHDPKSDAYRAACLAAVNHVQQEESLQQEMDDYVSSVRA